MTAPIARGDDEKAIKVLLDTFIKAFNAGNAAAAAATYSDTAVVVDEAGERLEGRAAIRTKYAASFADTPGTTITIHVDALRFIGPETALEVGKSTITPAAGAGAPRPLALRPCMSSKGVSGSRVPCVTSWCTTWRRTND